MSSWHLVFLSRREFEFQEEELKTTKGVSERAKKLAQPLWSYVIILPSQVKERSTSLRQRLPIRSICIQHPLAPKPRTHRVRCPNEPLCSSIPKTKHNVDRFEVWESFPACQFLAHPSQKLAFRSIKRNFRLKHYEDADLLEPGITFSPFFCTDLVSEPGCRRAAVGTTRVAVRHGRYHHCEALEVWETEQVEMWKWPMGWDT
jgi:hypothetical protein